MQDILHLLSENGLIFVFFGIIIEGTAVIIISGALCHMGVLPCEKSYFVAVLGAITGDQIWYFIGKYAANRVLDKMPNIKERVQKITAIINQKADLLAFGSRFVYSGAVVFPMALAMNNYPHKRFTILDALGVSLASMLGLAIGYFLSGSLKSVLGEINHFEHISTTNILFSNFNEKKKV